MGPAIGAGGVPPGMLWRYSFVSALALLANVGCSLAGVRIAGPFIALYAADVGIECALLFLAAVVLPVAALDRILPRRNRWRIVAIGSAAVLGTSAAHLFIYLDRQLFRMYDFHVNGFVWNLVTTRGGLDSLGAGRGTALTLTLIAAAFLALQTGLLFLVVRVRWPRALGPAVPRRRIWAAAGLILSVFGFDKLTYASSRYRGYQPVLETAAAFPFYVPCSWSGLFRALGVAPAGREMRLSAPSGIEDLRYPRGPLRRSGDRRPVNLVWLVAESWRADMLDPEVMPATWSFARTATRFTDHYSGGNGTRMGMFTMFYGLHGCYWFPCLNGNRGPVLMDVLLDDGYQMDLRTSALFSYPEFDRTIFTRIPRERLHEGNVGKSWECDRANVAGMLDFLDRRDPSRPFLAFMFFESPHAGYQFPEETAIRRPYAPEMDYLSMDLKRDIGPLKNRYVNACRHLDTQFARVFSFLESSGLLDSTVVLVTGDHGEEFMEKGHWGHASAFTEEQVRVPLVIRIPGRAPSEIDRLTSHLDIPATLLTLLGVSSPPGDYSHGFDLFGPQRRPYAVLSGWEYLGYVDDHWKADLPIQSIDWFHRRVTSREDVPVPDRHAFFEENRANLLELLRELARFRADAARPGTGR
jgi:hypothetical protein